MNRQKTLAKIRADLDGLDWPALLQVAIHILYLRVRQEWRHYVTAFAANRWKGE